MARFLVTGRGGSGKSAICVAMQGRGLPAFDGDQIPGLTRWESLTTGQPVKVDSSGYVDHAKVGWNWNEQVLRAFLISHPSVILCGSASNQMQFHNLFDRVFVLVLSSDIHAERLAARQSSYGKHPALRQEIVQRHQEFAQAAIAAGAAAIDAKASIEQTINNILEGLANESRKLA